MGLDDGVIPGKEVNGSAIRMLLSKVQVSVKYCFHFLSIGHKIFQVRAFGVFGV